MSLEYRNPEKETTETASFQIQLQPLAFVPKREALFGSYQPVLPDPRTARERLKGLSWRYVGAGAAVVVLVTAVGFACIYWGIVHFLIQGIKFGVMGIAACWTWAKFHIAPERLKRLMDVPPLQAQYPVEVTCLAHGKNVIGQDRGFITFVDGHLLFEGHRFRLDMDTGFLCNDLGPLLSSLDSPSRKTKNRRTIPWFHNGFSGKIQIDIYDQVVGVGKDYQKLFSKDLKKWCMELPKEEGRFLMPPLLPDQALLKRLSTTRDGGVMATIFFAAIGLILEFSFNFGFFGVAEFFLIASCLCGIFAWKNHVSFSNAKAVEVDRLANQVPQP